MPISPIVLRNKGVPVTVACVVVGPDGIGTPILDGDEPRTEERWVRVTNNTLADIEDVWGDFTKFAEATAEKPASAIRKFLALVWEEDPKVTGLRMLVGRLDEYAAACAASIMISQGVDPQTAAQLLETGVKVTNASAAAATLEVEKMLAGVDKALEERVAELTGEPGSPGGSDSDSIPAPSGV